MGVPHIFAETEVGAIYGQGYAMAEDRLPAIMKAYRIVLGRMAEVFGPEWVEHDYQQHGATPTPLGYAIMTCWQASGRSRQRLSQVSTSI